jgi:hypothetical protein
LAIKGYTLVMKYGQWIKYARSGFQTPATTKKKYGKLKEIIIKNYLNTLIKTSILQTHVLYLKKNINSKVLEKLENGVNEKIW